MGRLGIKHLIECHCILPQFKKKDPPIYHKFSVYSKFTSLESDKIKVKYIQCNNCNTMHKITDICRSEIVIGKEEDTTNLSIEEMSYSIDEKLSNVLSINNCDYATWEQVIDIVENEMWDSNVVIKRSIIDDKTHIKLLSILSESKFRIKNKILEDEIIIEV